MVIKIHSCSKKPKWKETYRKFCPSLFMQLNSQLFGYAACVFSRNWGYMDNIRIRVHSSAENSALSDLYVVVKLCDNFCVN
jgi:hypothetical protein